MELLFYMSSCNEVVSISRTAKWLHVRLEHSKYELHNLYYSPYSNKIVGACSMYWIDKKCVQISVRKSEGKRPLVRQWHRWEINIKWILMKQ